MAKLHIVRVIPMHAKVLHSEWILFRINSAPTSFTWCKTKLDISAQSFLCLHNKYTVKIVANREIIAEINV